jgi:DNA-binding winged helix-turn-helix (wHTH) protein
MMRAAPLQIGDWHVRPDLNEITRGAIRVRLEPKAMATLLVLADRPGDVVTKAELLERVWPGTFVVDGAVFRVLSELRRALGDDARTPAYVETIPKRGYRLVAPVTTPASSPSGSIPMWLVAAGAAAAVLAATAGAATWISLAARGAPTPNGAAPVTSARHAATAIEPTAFAAGQVWEDRADCGAYARARSAYERALVDAPGYRPAYLHLIDSYIASTVIGCLQASEATPRVNAALDALAAAAPGPEAESAEVVRRQAGALLWLQGDRQAAAERFATVSEIADVSRAALLLSLGEGEAAVAEAWRAWREAPAELGENFSLALVLLYTNHAADAVRQFDETLDLYPGFPPALSLKALAHLLDGDAPAAAAAARVAGAALHPPLDRFSSVPGLVFARLEQHADARAFTQRWRAMADHTRWTSPTAHAIAALAVDNRAEARAWLQRARDERDPWLVIGPHDPLLAGLEGISPEHPRQ